MSSANPDLPRLMLSLSRALLGEVPWALRRVATKIEGKVITIQFVFDGPISDDDRESASCVVTEVIASFPADHTVHDECVQIDAPQKMPDPGEGWRAVFERKEPRSKSPQQ